MSPNLLKELEKEQETEVDKKVENEKEIQEPVKENILKNFTEPLYVPKQEELNPQEDSIKSVNLFSASAFEKESVIERKQLFQPVKQELPEVEIEKIEEPQSELQVQEEIKQDLTQEEFFEVKAKVKPKNKHSQFRLKLFTAVFCIIMAATTGWVITNAVRTVNLNNSIEAAETVYSANEIKLITNIEKLDDLNSQNPEDNATTEIIEQIITVQPLPLENPTEYEQTSNFFDSLCNWISGLFGG